MVSSMTAFARAEKTAEKFKVSIEIRSYNSRHLDLAIRMPHGYPALEERIKSLAAEKVSRGRVEVKLQIVDESEEAHVFEINEVKARAYHQALVQLKDQLNIDTAISLELLTGAGGMIVPAEIERDMEIYRPAVEDCLNQALYDLLEMRKKEGDLIAKDIAGRLEFIENKVDQIKKESAGFLDICQQRLKERILVLTKGMVEIDPARVAQEAAFFADKSDISEEIVRTASHLKHFRTIMNAAEPAGRKLNFLLQELSREFNTMGSKTVQINLSHMIVEVKSELEKIREQVQNVE